MHVLSILPLPTSCIPLFIVYLAQLCSFFLSSTAPSIERTVKLTWSRKRGARMGPGPPKRHASAIVTDVASAIADVLKDAIRVNTTMTLHCGGQAIAMQHHTLLQRYMHMNMNCTCMYPTYSPSPNRAPNPVPTPSPPQPHPNPTSTQEFE